MATTATVVEGKLWLRIKRTSQKHWCEQCIPQARYSEAGETGRTE